MSTSNFDIKTHIFEAQHIRHYPGATRNGDSDIQRLEAKQYIPRTNQTPRDGDVTIIGLHATSFPKELYEPLWEDLLAASDSHGFRIRSIWIADASNQNASGVLNEQALGDDPSFNDYARDILHMTNVFREHMVAPIVGVGHSIGGAALIQLSCIHPRLFASLVLIDPILGMDTMATGQRLIPFAATKPDLFPSREVAQKGFKKAFKNWDERAFQRWMEFGLRDTPTLLYPEPGKVTLRTTKANEAWSYARTQFDEANEDGTKSKTDWIKYPDTDPTGRPFYRPEGLEAMEMLPRIRADVLFVFPQYTAASAQSNERNVAQTGIAIGGSGGAKEGKVSKVNLKNAGHLCPFEVPPACAKAIGEWLGPELKAWKERCVYEREHRDDKSVDGIRLSERFIREAKQFGKTGSSSKSGKL
ncbi:hypothetical protein PRZ48_002866 [Zasmidium cellare]|uniref:AB hydrolase-1 domain-containing protein n=1 Tax=Zasmidium cellare TaxID=395010 RepID=A0ABR0EUS0_ZASCE|nr:hypothetical protein PRZ48_002866 [Zasmidium cellare]